MTTTTFDVSKLYDLRDAVAETLLDRIRSGNASPEDLSNAVNFLAVMAGEGMDTGDEDEADF